MFNIGSKMGILDSEEASLKIDPLEKRGNPLRNILENIWGALRPDGLGREIAKIAFPAALALTADPIASLVDTGFIGRIGPVQLAAVGVSIAIFNQVSKVFNFPLVSVTTSLVAEEDGSSEVLNNDSEIERLVKDTEANEKEELATPHNTGFEKRVLPSVSSALILGVALGIIEAIILVIGAGPILNIMGIHSDSPMKNPAEQYLKVRAIGAPAIVLSLASQGVFRGFKDTTTPLYATVAGNISNIALDPLLIFFFKLGVSGAAIAHTLSQYLICFILLWRLSKQVALVPAKMSDLNFSRFFSSGLLLIARVIAVTFSLTLAASMAARLGPVPMSAFQICLQIWMATSLLADALALAGQAILASAFAKADYVRAKNTAARILQMGLVLGILLAAFLGSTLHLLSNLFTNDVHVLKMMYVGIPFVAATQPINTLAFVFDGINYGASDFAYSAYSMICVSIVTILCLLLLSSLWGFVGIWISMTIFMTLRMIAGVWRIGTSTGPWKFMRQDVDVSMKPLPS